MQILILHGPNLNLLGDREVEVYGAETLEAINDRLQQEAKKLNVTLAIHQSNHEGVLVDLIHRYRSEVAGILFNPGAFSHYSIALHDALRAVSIPCVEVHLSNVLSRESFRHQLVTAAASAGLVAGFGGDSYIYGLWALVELVQKKQCSGTGK